MAELSKWDQRFMDMAGNISQWSRDPSTKCGCVIVQDKRVVATGFNGFPSGIDDEPSRYMNREQKMDLVIHAEINAILNAVASVKGATLYVVPIAVCHHCAPIIIQSGIRRVVMGPIINRWAESQHKAIGMFNEAGVTWRSVDVREGDAQGGAQGAPWPSCCSDRERGRGGNP